MVLSSRKWLNEEYAKVHDPFGKKKNMLRRAWVSKMHSNGSIDFEDGSSLQGIDVVMFCTGSASPA